MQTELKVDPAVPKTLSELNQMAGDAQEQLRIIIQGEGYFITPNLILTLSVKFQNSFGINAAPEYLVTLESYEDFDTISGYGDTVEASLKNFWTRFRERASGKGLPSYLIPQSEHSKERLLKRDPVDNLVYDLSKGPCKSFNRAVCDPGADGCKCRVEGGELV